MNCMRIKKLEIFSWKQAVEKHLKDWHVEGRAELSMGPRGWDQACRCAARGPRKSPLPECAAHCMARNCCPVSSTGLQTLGAGLCFVHS